MSFDLRLPLILAIFLSLLILSNWTENDYFCELFSCFLYWDDEFFTVSTCFLSFLKPLKFLRVSFIDQILFSLTFCCRCLERGMLSNCNELETDRFPLACFSFWADRPALPALGLYYDSYSFCPIEGYRSLSNDMDWLIFCFSIHCLYQFYRYWSRLRFIMVWFFGKVVGIKLIWELPRLKLDLSMKLCYSFIMGLIEVLAWLRSIEFLTMNLPRLLLSKFIAFKEKVLSVLSW